MVNQLEHRFSVAVTQIAVWTSEGATMNYQGSGGGEHGHRILWAGGNTNTDTQTWIARWNGCETTQHQTRVLHDLEQELRNLREPVIRRPQGETDEQRTARILKDTRSWSPDDVAKAVSLGVSKSQIVKMRKAHGLHPETGMPLTGRLAAKDRRRKVAELHNQGVTSPSEIARKLGEPNHWNILRDLRTLQHQ